ncbi:M23 family metallopeptidase [Paenibacillus graminis]|uniref:M23 family metallopeptidase n=1 Tax=Paenibacillus graminis TaxID=189425 RepID=UPI002DB95CC5|nr:peptidoglycan DD-metalloendopeptidase family protein [Paenibacillus graminis]MEC0169918.1 peptidoglycan DD-metalloendopeptidase family protein [Paenibacillus graminis]
MAGEQTIRVSAKGEFGQLQRGLKQLQQDLKGVSGVVDKGASRGGFFDEKQTRALELYKRRFMGTMNELNAEFRKQNDVVEALYSKMSNAQRAEREEIRQTISQREKQLDVLRKEIMATERLYNQRSKESNAFGRPPSSSKSSGDILSGGNGRDQGSGGGILSGLMSAGKFAFGLAGLTGIASLATKAYDLSYERATGSLDLAQRLRGRSGWTGNATDMWDRSGDAGRSDRMGYTAAESWGFLEQYSRIAGAISAGQQQDLLKFGRGYGLNTSEVAGVVGANQAIGGTQTPKGFADAIAGSVAKTGMTPRILEVMETNNALLSQMNTTLKDGSSKQILAYQTTLDRIGVEKGMTQLTGAQGGNLIAGLGGIFQPGNDKWKWMGIQALQDYSPQKYGAMDLFDLEMSYEDGLMNADNLPAMTKYIRSQTGGNKKLDKYIMQRWLTDGGYAATKREASEFYDATDGLSKFSPDQIESLKNGSIDSGAKYDTERHDETGQGYIDTDARFQHFLEANIGRPIVTAVTGIQDAVVTKAEELTNGVTGLSDIMSKLSEIVNEGLSALISGTSDVAKGALDGLVEGAINFFDGKNTTPKEPEFRTPEQRRQYYQELEQENRDMSAARDKAVNGPNGLLSRQQKGEVLSTEEQSLLSEWINQSYKDNLSLGKLKESIVNKAADAAGVTAQAGGKAAVQFGAAAGDVLLGLPSSEEQKITGDAIMDRLITRGTDLKNKQDSGQKLTGSEKNTLSVSPSGDNLLVRAQRGEKLNNEERNVLAQWVNQDYQERLKNGEAKKTYLDSAAEATGGILQGAGKGIIEGVSELANWLSKSFLGTPANASGSRDAGDSEIGRLTKNMTGGIEDFADTGITRLRGMDRTTRDMADNADTKYQTMEKNSGSLLDKSVYLFRSMYYKVANVMDEVSQGHRGLISSLQTAFSGLTGSGYGYGGAQATGFSAENYKITNKSGVTAQALNAKLGGVLAGYGSTYVTAGEMYGIDPAFLAALSMHETGNGTSPGVKNKNNVGGMMRSDGNGQQSFSNLTAGVYAMARNLARNYVPKGIDTIEGVQQKYAPIGVGNDPRNLNKNWVPGVTSYLQSLIGSSSNTGTYDPNFIGPLPAGTHGSTQYGGTIFGKKSKSFFNGWQDRITTKFDKDLVDNSHPNGHGGLDIDGNQGDLLDALAAGTISFIKMDDGGANDPDGKANTNKGGTSVGVRMKDGNVYFYSHLSAVNPSMKVGGQVAAGDWIGNMGGDPGEPGSGYSTTGSHLHLGYMNEATQELMSPVKLLNGLNAGDSEIGKMNPEQFVASVGMSSGSNSPQSQQVVTTKSEITVKLDLTGEGAKTLNNATLGQLEKLVSRIMTERERQRLRMSPTKAGYS